MIISGSLERSYYSDFPYVEHVGNQVNQTLIPYCEKNFYAYQYRYKDLESVAEKIETGRFSSWDEIDDLFAATIIIPDLNKEDSVVNFLRSIFRVETEKKRGSTLKAPEVFRFDSTRIIAGLKPIRELREKVYQIKFEIQIRTAFEHAWSAATHSLVYKSDTIDWRAHRLAAQIKAAVENLDMIIAGFSDTHRHITLSQWPSIDYLSRIIEFFNQNELNERIPQEVRPKDQSRFANNLLALIRSSSNCPRREMWSFLEDILETILLELSRYDKNTFPRSISLLSLCLGLLTDSGKLLLPLKNYVPVITQEVENLFPILKQVGARFGFPPLT